MTRSKRRNKRTPRKKKHFLFRTFFTQFPRTHKYITSFLLCILILGGISTYHVVQTQPSPVMPDDRPARIDAYFSKYNMPLAGYGASFIAAADSCGLDWRLLPAIAVRESSGGKRMQYNNPFGWGGAHIPFENIDDAIREVGKNLCGENPKTARWYGTPSVHKKLYYYNGTVIPTYPREVAWIMKQF